MWLPPTWDICGLGLSKWKFLFVLILYTYLVAFSIHFLLWSHPNVVEPRQLLTAPSAQNSTRDSSITQKRGFTCLAPAPSMLPGIVLNVQTIFFSSTPQYSLFENFLNYLCLIMYFPRKADEDSSHLGMAEGTASRPGQDDWAGKPALIQIIPQRTRERRDSALPFCEATVLHNHAYGQHRINTSQTSLYLPVWASLRTTNLFPAKRSSSWKQKIVGLII